MVEMRNIYKILDRKPERKRPLGRPRRRLGIILKQIWGRVCGYRVDSSGRG
jgi:hypothetical protein